MCHLNQCKFIFVLHSLVVVLLFALIGSGCIIFGMYQLSLIDFNTILDQPLLLPLNVCIFLFDCNRVFYIVPVLSSALRDHFDSL